jgi:hypothetical protein
VYSGRTGLVTRHAKRDADRPFLWGLLVPFFCENCKVAGKLRVWTYFRDLLELLQYIDHRYHFCKKIQNDTDEGSGENGRVYRLTV